MRQHNHKTEGKYSKNNVNARRKELSKIIEIHHKKHEPITVPILLDELKKKNFIIDRTTLYRDKIELNKGDTFIRDMTESTYSGYMRAIWENLESFEQEAITLYKKDWTNNKTVTKTDPDGNKTIEKTKTESLAAPKAAFLNIVTDIEKAKYQLLTGHNIHLAAALLIQKFQQMKQRIYELENQNEALKIATQSK